MPFAKHFVIEEDATLILQKFPNSDAKNCTQAEEAFVLKQKHKHFQRKRKREQNTQIQVAERNLLQLGQGSILWSMFIPERMTV